MFFTLFPPCELIGLPFSVGWRYFPPHLQTMEAANKERTKIPLYTKSKLQLSKHWEEYMLKCPSILAAVIHEHLHFSQHNHL